MESILQTLAGFDPAYVRVFLAIMRFLAPLLAMILLCRCLKPLVAFKRSPEIWGWLQIHGGDRVVLTHWENIIGRSKSSDVVVNVPTISRNHAVLTRYDDGSWTVTDAGSKSGTLVNGMPVKIHAMEDGDVINIGGVDMTLTPITPEQEARMAQHRVRHGSGIANAANLMLLTLFQLLVCLSFLLTGDPEHYLSMMQGFGGILAAEWALMIFYLSIKRTSFEVETIAFFLCTMGMAVICTVVPGETMKQLISMFLGVGFFLTVGWSLRDLERAKKMRYIATVLGVGLLVFTLVFGDEQNGARAWIKIAGMNLQPSEISKVCFVYAGASAMDRLMNKRNMILFIGYSALICGCLALMNDFGTALIFFVAFLIIAFMRSGNVGTIGLACTALGFAGVIAVKIAPHALSRFTSWRHIWEDVQGAGFQQTRALMCIAAGGLFGLGAGQGRLKNYFAADSDIVFATISEEWGLLMAVMIVLTVVGLAIFTIRSAAGGRSSFYVIGAVTAAAIMVAQAILNALGTVDVMPFTGVTFPFVSNGGSSMIGAWGLLAFIKAADTRQNASFAVRVAGKEESE